MDEPTRRAWCRPELIVIVRSRPEEAVLMACKRGSGGPAGPGSAWVACEDISCGDCSWRTLS